jgi:hypothetical protein
MGAPYIYDISRLRVKDHLSEHMLTETEKSLWLTFKAGFLNFLGNLKAENYKELVEDLLKAYQTMGRNVSLHFYICTWTYSLRTWAQ